MSLAIPSRLHKDGPHSKDKTMNHCLLEVEVIQSPTIRYTQDNKTPLAEMAVQFSGLRPDDAPGEIKVVGWGNLAQELHSNVQTGQKLVLEGRLRMSTVPRQDGTKEKRAEFTLSKYHHLTEESKIRKPDADFSSANNSNSTPPSEEKESTKKQLEGNENEAAAWNSSPLIPDTDDIPF